MIQSGEPGGGRETEIHSMQGKFSKGTLSFQSFCVKMSHRAQDSEALSRLKYHRMGDLLLFLPIDRGASRRLHWSAARSNQRAEESGACSSEKGCDLDFWESYRFLGVVIFWSDPSRPMQRERRDIMFHICDFSWAP